MASVHGSRCKKPRLIACPDAETVTVQSVASENAADLAAALLQKVFRHLSFKRRMACEFVCRSWRNVLRCPGLSLSSRGYQLRKRLGIGQNCYDQRLPAYRTQRPVNGRNVTVHLNEVSGPFWGPQAAFLAWLRQRAAGFEV